MKFFAKFFKVMGIKIIKFQKYLKLVNSETNYTNNLQQSENYKNLIKEMIDHENNIISKYELKRCIHNRIKSQCKECQCSQICKHNKQKSKCKECKINNYINSFLV